MRRPAAVSVKLLIIGIAALLLSACSAIRLAYDNGTTLALWWLDGYLDLDSAQEARAKPVIDDWFAWHRSTQLPEYAQQLASWKQRAGGSVSGDELCRWSELVRDRTIAALDRVLPPAAELLPNIRPAQWQRMEKRYAERLTELREKHAQPDRAQRFEAALERAVERSEEWYGRLDPAQKKLLAEGIAQQPMEAEDWLAARDQRQKELLQTLRRAQQEPDLARRTTVLRDAMQRFMRPGDERQARWQSYGCELTAKLHNGTTPQQRAMLRERLAGYEGDLRALTAVAVAP